MKTIYLDRQIQIESYERSAEINSAIQRCVKAGFIFPYSPAHIEEISGSFCRGKTEDIDSQVEHLAHLSKCLAFMPHQIGHAELRFEDINACLSRVKDNGGRDETENAVHIEQYFLESMKISFNQERKFWDTMHDKCEKLPPHKIFSDWDVFSFLNHCAVTRNFRVRTDTFRAREATIDFLFKALNIFGFRKEHSQKRIENRIHDVSHAIYGSYADIFVSNDRKLRHSVVAVFSYIGLQVRILDRDEFLEFARAI